MPNNIDTSDISSASVPDALATLKVTAEAGLSLAEVASRRQERRAAGVVATLRQRLQVNTRCILRLGGSVR
jgi:hypothetical protein